MEKYDKDVIAGRFRAKRRARKSASSGNYDKTLNLILGVFALAALLLLAILVIGLWG